MVTRIKCNNVIDDGKVFGGYVYIENGKITAVTKDELPFDDQIDAQDNYLCAGFVDLHTHGAVGVDFTFCSPDEVVKACNFHFEHGTTAILPTTLASNLPTTLSALQSIKEAMNGGKAKGTIVGAHIEGPYFSQEMAGAQNPEYLTNPILEDYQAILRDFGDVVKKWSYAPERDEKANFCRYLVEKGVLPSAGHTNATFDEVKLAYDNGLRNVTHLYSCTSTITRHSGFRKLGVVESAYYFDDMLVEIIADGKHIPPELIQLVFKLKKLGTVMLVTDSLSIAGSSQKEGNLNGVDYVVEEGVAKLKDKTAFAGSVATMDVLVKQCVLAGVPLELAVMSASQIPAKSLGLNKGRIAVGYDADLVILDKDVNVVKVICCKSTH